MSDKNGDRNWRNKHRTTTTEGFVCPQCMVKFEESSHLIDHFTAQHGQTEPTEKVSAFQTFISTIRSDGILRRTVDSPAKPPQSNDAAKIAELDTEKSTLLDSLRNDNDELLQSLSEENTKVIELDIVANLILDGTPFPPGFKFRTASLERRVRRYLETSVDHATMKSTVETEFEALKAEHAGVTDALDATRLTVEKLQSQLSEVQTSEKEKSVGSSYATATVSTTMEADEPPCPMENSSGDQNALSSQLTTVNQELKDLERRRSSEVKALSKKLEAVKAELATAVQKADDSLKQSTALTRELDRLKEVERQLRGQLVNPQSRLKSLEQTVTGLETVKADLEAKCSTYQENQTQALAKLASVQSQRDQLTAKYDQLTAKYDQLTRHCALLETKSSDLVENLSKTRQENGTAMDKLTGQLQTAKRELDSLMLRLIKSEDQCKVLAETIGERDHQIENLKKITCELGRENQTLQILRERVSSRQWTRDEQVSICQVCCKEFSLSNRRHHCRVCGGIFCQACSSHRAPTPASKDPVRVCDTCFAETTRPA